jgi:hypothetical protein
MMALRDGAMPTTPVWRRISLFSWSFGCPTRETGFAVREPEGWGAPVRSLSLLRLHYSAAAPGFELSVEQIALDRGHVLIDPIGHLSRTKKEANTRHEAPS